MHELLPMLWYLVLGDFIFLYHYHCTETEQNRKCRAVFSIFWFGYRTTNFILHVKEHIPTLRCDVEIFKPNLHSYYVSVLIFCWMKAMKELAKWLQWGLLKLSDLFSDFRFMFLWFSVIQNAKTNCEKSQHSIFFCRSVNILSLKNNQSNANQCYCCELTELLLQCRLKKRRSFPLCSTLLYFSFPKLLPRSQHWGPSRF